MSTSSTSTNRLRAYYYLTKPGIVHGNTIAAAAGYLFGAGSSFSFITFFALVIGIGAVISSACVYNNILDRDIDAVMKRTQQRALVSGVISPLRAFIFATLLLGLGITVLLLGTNLTAMLFALGGHIAYALLYTYAKRVTVHGTLIGTISGSTPPVIGYVAATGQADMTALVLYLIMVTWQMPHFYAIALFRRDDYASAKVPVLSVVKGEQATRREIVFYVSLFIVFSALLGFTGASLFTTLVLILSGAYWLYICLLPPESRGGIIAWSRHQFGWSLTVLLVFCSVISLDQFFH